MVLVKDLRLCQFLVLYKIHQEKLFGYIFVKQQARVADRSREKTGRYKPGQYGHQRKTLKRVLKKR